ncbi:hypothetical protein B0H19DRAFT_1012740 [Mycena capillaripes]|nr:hypothetical protein B0H19DRAFT_1012740 [Mycena capillaripes]
MVSGQRTIDINKALVRLKITSATCSSFALGVTTYRLYKRRGKFWVDDLWALVAFVALIIQVVGVFLHIPVPNHWPTATHVAAFYLTRTTFYTIIWASRLSILFSIFRIDPSAERRKCLFWVSVAFVGAAAFLLGQLLWVCESQQQWKFSLSPQCELPLQIAICQLVSDATADLILLFSPLPLFRNLQNKSLGHKLILIFSTCVATTIGSIVHATFVLQNNNTRVAISGVVEGCLSLIVANIPVVVTTTIDIVGNADHGHGRTSQTGRFSTVFWVREAQTTAGVVELHAIGAEGTEDTKLAYLKSSKDTTSL